MKSPEDLISVVVPVHNVKAYLRMCAESIFSQTFRNLEIIFVDDGSTDGSEKICDALAEEDSRVRVIHQENKGVSVARNTGIDACTGSLIYFVDSDDAISPVTIAHLWTALIRTNADAAVGDFMRFSEMQVPNERRKFTFETIDTEETLRRMLMNEGFGHQPWGKLFRRSLWETKRFPPGIVYEDYDLLYDLMLCVKKTAVVSDAMYYYRMQADSIMHQKIDENKLSILDTADRVTRTVSEAYPSLRGPAVRRQVVSYMRFLSDLLETDYNLFPEAQKKLIDTVRGLKKEFLRAPGVRRADKMKLRALMTGKRAFYLMYKVFDLKNKKVV